MWSFSSGLTAIRATQIALDTLSSNIANASTPGYHRRQVALRERPARVFGSLSIGRGVDVAGIPGGRSGGPEGGRAPGRVTAASRSRSPCSPLAVAVGIVDTPPHGVSCRAGDPCAGIRHASRARGCWPVRARVWTGGVLLLSRRPAAPRHPKEPLNPSAPEGLLKLPDAPAPGPWLPHNARHHLLPPRRTFLRQRRG